MSDLHDEKTTEIKEGKRRRRGESRKGTRKGEKGERKWSTKRRVYGDMWEYSESIRTWCCHGNQFNNT